MTEPERLPEQIAADPLLIRRWHRRDVDAMSVLIVASLEHLRPWMAWAEHEPVSAATRVRQFTKWDDYWMSGHGAVYGVFDDDVAIGGCAMHRRVGPGGLDIGYWLGVEHTGRGHATRIADALTNAACVIPDVTFAAISHESRNEASGAVARRLGYTRLASETHGDVSVTRWRRTCPDLA